MQNNYKLKIIKSLSHNPWYNLALEEQLFYEVKDDEIMLYLWQNEKTVVIGRNQNPWRECKSKELENDGGKLARRLSGGGAVFHDLGNLNFTFIMKKGVYDIKRQLQVIINAVNKFDINAEFSGRNDIIADGRKFSGNAFYYDNDRCYHHGTLLVNADMTILPKYLVVSKEKIKSKGVKSVKSRVINLNEINPNISVDKLSNALEESLKETYNADISEYVVKDGNDQEIKELYNKYSSWEWRYGETPNFEIEFYNRFNFGDIDLNFNLKDGYIDKVATYSDAMDPEFIMDIRDSLVGVPFTKEAIISKLDELKVKYDDKLLSEVQNWINEKEI